MDRVSGIVFGSLLFCVGLALCLKIWKKRTNKVKLPSTVQWKQVGTLKYLQIVPVKSCKPVLLEEAECTEYGLAQIPIPGLYTLKDRYFVVYRHDTLKVLYSATYPLMSFIETQPISEDSVLFKYRDKPDLKLTIPTPNGSNYRRCTRISVEYLDCGDEASDWITEVIKGDKNAEGKLRIGYMLDATKSIGTDENYATQGPGHSNASYLLMTSSSVQDLADKVPEHKIDYRRFRPSLFVETAEKPFAEDNWSWVKIGKDTIFVKIMNSERCIRVNLDPDTGRYNTRREPYSVLKKYRCFNTNANDYPVMGIYMGLYKAGKVKIGDPVYAAM